MLSVLNEPTRKILTIEDPVEYELQGINQSQAKPAIGLTFAMALRAFVRQDPDVIMVGEIRDPETAQIAIHAALTGHLVLTTLHTETAAAAVPRLLDLGVEGFLLKSTLRAVIAQRLVRQLCDRCKTHRKLSRADLAADPRYSGVGLKVGETIFEPGKCERCGGTGYRGRGRGIRGPSGNGGGAAPHQRANRLCIARQSRDAGRNDHHGRRWRGQVPSGHNLAGRNPSCHNDTVTRCGIFVILR